MKNHQLSLKWYKFVENGLIMEFVFINMINLLSINIYIGGIRLCDSLEFVTSEKSGKLAQNKTR